MIYTRDVFAGPASEIRKLPGQLDEIRVRRDFLL